ncbi:hypothetical protein [Aeromicrobium chenweiae]|nr:hypothetical protein [Aeromicrobium chenweiae]
MTEMPDFPDPNTGAQPDPTPGAPEPPEEPEEFPLDDDGDLVSDPD